MRTPHLSQLKAQVNSKLCQGWRICAAANAAYAGLRVHTDCACFNVSLENNLAVCDGHQFLNDLHRKY